MTLRGVDNDPCDEIRVCPICGGHMEHVYERPHQVVCVCADCKTSLTIPAAARTVARQKRERKSS